MKTLIRIALLPLKLLVIVAAVFISPIAATIHWSSDNTIYGDGRSWDEHWLDFMRDIIKIL